MSQFGGVPVQSSGSKFGGVAVSPNTYDEATIRAQGRAKRSEGVNEDGSIPGKKGNLDRSKAGDNWSTIGTSEDGLNVTRVVPGRGLIAKNPAEFLGEQFRRTGDSYGAYETDQAGEESMRQDQPQSTTSQSLGFRKGITTPVDNARMWLEGGLKKLGVPTDRINSFLGVPSASSIRDKNKKYVADQEAKGVKPGFWGEMTGNIVGTAPIFALTKNPMLIGAGSGALSSNSDTAGGVALDAGLGSLGGKVAATGLRAAGAVIAPYFRPAVNAMLKAGVRLTPGQIMGGGLHKMEDASTSLFGIGDLVTSAQQRGLGDYNKVAVNEALRPFGMKVPDNIAPGHESVKFAQDTIDAAYNHILPQMTVHLTPTFRTGVQSVMADASRLNPDGQRMFTNMLRDDVLARFHVPGQNALPKNISMRQALARFPNSIDGHTFKEMDEVLGKEARRFNSSPSPHDRAYADTIADLQHHLRMAAADTNPTLAPTIRAIDHGYSNLVRVETAAAPARKGVFTPERLAEATRKNDPTMRKRASAAGQAKMQDLAEHGMDTMTRTVGETGTASRAVINAAAAAALYGGQTALNINPMAMAALAPILGLYTRTGNAAFRAAIRRPAGAASVRAGMRHLRPVAGAAGGHSVIAPGNPPVEGD